MLVDEFKIQNKDKGHCQCSRVPGKLNMMQFKTLFFEWCHVDFISGGRHNE